MVSGDPNPPFLKTYEFLLNDCTASPPPPPPPPEKEAAVVDLPLIDLSRLSLDPDQCEAEIRFAAAEWGFFQVIAMIIVAI